jgi:hypothetical protein
MQTLKKAYRATIDAFRYIGHILLLAMEVIGVFLS